MQPSLDNEFLYQNNEIWQSFCQLRIKETTNPKFLPQNYQYNQISNNIPFQTQQFNINSTNSNLQFQMQETILNNNFDKNRKIRVPFSKEEDEKIKLLVDLYGAKNWALISSFINGRTPKQCRDRYKNYLAPGFFLGQWTNEEDELLKKLYEEYGPKWSTLAKSFNDRSPGSIKNRWKYFLCRQCNHNKELNSDNIKGDVEELEKTDILFPKNENINPQKNDDIISQTNLPKQTVHNFFIDSDSEIFQNVLNCYGDWTVIF